jgi:hypothetical protein
VTDAEGDCETDRGSARAVPTHRPFGAPGGTERAVVPRSRPETSQFACDDRALVSTVLA